MWMQIGAMIVAVAIPATPATKVKISHTSCGCHINKYINDHKGKWTHFDQSGNQLSERRKIDDFTREGKDETRGVLGDVLYNVPNG